MGKAESMAFDMITHRHYDLGVPCSPASQMTLPYSGPSGPFPFPVSGHRTSSPRHLFSPPTHSVTASHAFLSPPRSPKARQICSTLLTGADAARLGSMYRSYDSFGRPSQGARTGTCEPSQPERLDTADNHFFRAQRGQSPHAVVSMCTAPRQPFRGSRRDRTWAAAQVTY